MANPAPPAKTQPRVPPRQTWIAFAVILLLNYALMKYLFPGEDVPVTVPYTTFKEEALKGNVRAIYSQGTSIEGRFVSPVTWPPQGGASPPPGAKRAIQPKTSDTFTTEL